MERAVEEAKNPREKEKVVALCAKSPIVTMIVTVTMTVSLIEKDSQTVKANTEKERQYAKEKKEKRLLIYKRIVVTVTVNNMVKGMFQCIKTEKACRKNQVHHAKERKEKSLIINTVVIKTVTRMLEISF